MAQAGTKDVVPNFEKLHGDWNWPLWKSRMKTHYQANELWDIITGAEAAPAGPDVPREQLRAYNVKCARIKNILNQMLDDEVAMITLRDNLETPQQCWDALIENFDRPTLTNKMQLLQRLLNIKLIPGMSIDKYFQEFQDIQQRLASLRVDLGVLPDLNIAILLNGLSTEYEVLRTSFVTKGEVTPTELREALRNEESRRQDHPSSSNTAMAATITPYRRGRGSSRGPQAGRSRCRGRERGRGDFQNQNQNGRGCTNFRNQNTFWNQHNFQDQNNLLGPCYTCGEYGHLAKECQSFQNRSVQEERDKEEMVWGPDSIEERGSGLMTVLYGAKTQGNEFIVDSGATTHMVNDNRWLKNYKKLSPIQPVLLGDGHACMAIGKGTLVVNCPFKNQIKEVILREVLHVPDISCNFISVHVTTNLGNSVTFKEKGAIIRDPAGQILAVANKEGKNYILQVSNDERKQSLSATSTEETNDNYELWHNRMGHCGIARLKKAAKSLVRGMQLITSKEPKFCEGCAQGKMKRRPYPPLAEVRSQETLELIHSDICGPMSVESLGGKKYFVIFIDDHSRYSTVVLIRNKSDVLPAFQDFDKETETKFGHRIRALRTDNGGEYCSAEFENYLKSRGIKHYTTVPYSPAQNGVAERKNGLIQEMGIAMLTKSGKPRSFWGEAVNTAVYIQNRLPTESTGSTPYQRWFTRKPAVGHMRIFGCTAYALKPDHEKQKFGPKADKTTFLGYANGQKGYRLFDPEKNRLIIRRDVLFDENDFGQKKKCNPISFSEKREIPRGQEPENENEKEEKLGEDKRKKLNKETGTEQPKRRTTRKNAGIPPQKYGDRIYQLDSIAEIPAAYHCLFQAAPSDEPRTIEDALNREDGHLWKEATDKEFSSLQEMQTWDLVNLPEDRRVVSCKWTFRKKYNADGSTERYKARLVARGFTQQHGIDFQETFAPVVRLNSLRTLLALAIQMKMVIHQMDVITAYLNGELDAEIYMEQPPGYTEQGKENLVCKLKRSLYGLKQSGRCWNLTLVKFLKSKGFTQLQSDQSVFYRKEPLTFLTTYVDDLVLMTETAGEMENLKQILTSGFKMKDMGPIHYILGIQMDMSNGTLKMSQPQYILKLLKNFGQTAAKIVSTPADPNITLKKEDDSNPVDPKYYQSLIGSLLFLALATRPDIQYAVNMVARYSSCPTTTHLTAAKRILKYLKGTIEKGLTYRPDHPRLLGFSDADFARDVDDRKSTTGYVFTFGGSPISWYSGKQKCVSVSTSAAEYIALGATTREGLFHLHLLNEIGIDLTPLTIFEDNQSALAIAKNPVYHSRQKHIDIQHHFIRDELTKGTIIVEYCNSETMLADIFTKPMPKVRFEKIIKFLGLQ